MWAERREFPSKGCQITTTQGHSARGPRIRKGTTRLDVADGKAPLLDAAGIHSLDDALRLDLGDPIAASRSTWVRRVPAGTSHVYVKVLTYPTAKDLLLRILSRRFLWHRARREWRCIKLQQDMGLPAAGPVCFGELRHHGFLRAAVLVTEEIPGATRLDDWLRNGDADGRAAAASAGAYVARLHLRGFHHGDLNARNVLVTTNAGGSLDFWNVDSGRGRRSPWHRRVTVDHIRDIAPVALACRAIAGEEAMQECLHSYAAAVLVPFTAATARMLEAEMLRIEPRERRRLHV
jgi:tRNA A-37 threonylcarbamoyl transferase component Bud32